MKNLSHVLLLGTLSLTLANTSLAETKGPQSFMDFFDGDRLVNPWLKDASGQFTIQVSTTFSTQKTGESAVQTIAAPTYQEVFRNQLKTSQNVPALNSLEAKYAAENSNYQNLNLTARAQALSNYIFQQYKVRMSNETVLAALTIEQIKAHPDRISSITGQVKNSLSLGQKIQIASHFGKLFAEDYNYGRVGSNNPAGYVPLESLVEALAQAQNGGVCRDISLAQGQLLNQLGVPSKNIYTMSFQTPTAHHAILVLQDPESNRIIKINYGTVTTSEKAGSAGLSVGGKHQVSGIQYKFYDVNGKPVQAQETSLGRLLKDLTGGTPVFGDSLAPYNVSKVIVSTRWGQAAVFTGNLIDSNDKVTGVAFNSIDLSNYMGPHTEVGIAVIDRNSDDKTYEFNQKGLYLNLRTMREKDFLIGPVKATARAGADAQFAALYTTVEKNGQNKSSTQTEYSSSVFTALNLDYKNYETGILAVGYIDFQHVAKAASGGYTMAVNNIRLHAGTKKVINNNLVATGKAFLTLREVGNTLNFEGALNQQNRALSLNYQKPLDDIPLMFDGSTEVIRLRGQSQSIPGTGRKSRSSRVDLRYDRDQKETQAELGLQWRW